tara:strand:+ start:2752 stop:4146 length:1395 start_codon:yes stop_codon:yes gene_type:complete
MKIKIKISSPDDSSDNYTTSFLFRSNVPNYNRRVEGRNKFGEIVFRCRPQMANDKTLDPILSALQTIIDGRILQKNTSRSRYRYAQNGDNSPSVNYSSIFTWKFNDGNFTMVYQQTKSQFYINGMKLNKVDIMSILSKVIYKTCFVRNSKELYTYLNQLIVVPPNVMYCVENRTPYSFWDVRPSSLSHTAVRGKKYSVTLNTQIISETECALEISENIWATITIKELNQFINYHKFDKQRSKKWALMPENLWCALFGTMPSYSQKNLMYSFLQQNRTQDRVEERAQQLLVDLTKEHPNQIYKFITRTTQMQRGEEHVIPSNSLLVRGTISDWMLIPNNSRSMHQKVNAYKVIGEYQIDEWTILPKKYTPISIFESVYQEIPNAIIGLVGPICIDTLHGNSSEGDQMASRALALMNDKVTGNYIKTLKPYMDSQTHVISDNVLLNMQEYGATYNTIKNTVNFPER